MFALHHLSSYVWWTYNNTLGFWAGDVERRTLRQPQHSNFTFGVTERNVGTSIFAKHPVTVTSTLTNAFAGFQSLLERPLVTLPPRKDSLHASKTQNLAETNLGQH